MLTHPAWPVAVSGEMAWNAVIVAILRLNPSATNSCQNQLCFENANRFWHGSSFMSAFESIGYA